MAYKTLLVIDGVTINNIVSYDDLASTQDGEKSGRVPSLHMNRDILGRIMSIDVTLGITPVNEGMVILNLLKNPEMRVQFRDSETDTLKTIECYCVDPKKSRLEGMMDYFETIQFQLVSIARYD
ncbi:hypothetical protein A4S06_05395 [Erysipelotrichaceae bacterium MTC7]|nr:hypothetical protein A4S06_05395 [Erysipelotrichaceae bacterium MTC7]